MLTRTAIALSAFILVACAGLDEGGPDDDCGAKCDDVDESGEATINGIPAAEYYGLLTYEVFQERQTPFRYASSWSDATLDNGDWAEVDLYLLESGSYYVVYSEWTRVNSTESHQVGDIEILEGQWGIEGTTLIVGTLAFGSGQDFSTNNGQTVPGISLEFRRDIGASGLTRAPLVMAQTFSSGGLFHELDKHDDGTCDSELGEYCAYGTDCGPCICGDDICQSTFSWLENETNCPQDCSL